MKIFTVLFLCLLAVPAFAQVSARKQDDSASKARPGRNDTESPVISTLARALVNSSDSLVVSAWTGSLVFEGATEDAYETTFSITDPTADRTITFPNASGAVVLGAGVADAAHAITFGNSTIVAEGATADGFETTLSFTDPTADQTLTIPNFGVNGAFVLSSLTTNNIDAANSIWLASNSVVLEGATADGFESTVSPVDPTADQTLSIPNFGVNGAFMLSSLTTNTIDAANSLWFASNALVMEGATADAFELTVAPADVTADQTITLPNATGTVALATPEDVTATNVITASENGSIFFLNSGTEFESTLPAPALGLHFTFIVTAAPSSASYTIVTDSSANIIKGVQVTAEDAGGSGDSGTADDTITLVDGQAVAGDKIEVWSDGTSWFAYATTKVVAGATFTQDSP